MAPGTVNTNTWRPKPRTWLGKCVHKNPKSCLSHFNRGPYEPVRANTGHGLPGYGRTPANRGPYGPVRARTGLYGSRFAWVRPYPGKPWPVRARTGNNLPGYARVWWAGWNMRVSTRLKKPVRPIHEGFHKGGRPNAAPLCKGGRRPHPFVDRSDKFFQTCGDTHVPTCPDRLVPTCFS